MPHTDTSVPLSDLRTPPISSSRFPTLPPPVPPSVPLWLPPESSLDALYCEMDTRAVGHPPNSFGQYFLSTKNGRTTPEKFTSEGKIKVEQVYCHIICCLSDLIYFIILLQFMRKMKKLSTICTHVK